MSSEDPDVVVFPMKEKRVKKQFGKGVKICWEW
jgi:hypothetical protein